MVADKVKQEWISSMCRDYPKIPKFVVEELADTYAIDDGEWLKENKKKGEKFARKQAKKGKKTVSQAEQDPDKFKIPGAIEVEHLTEEKRAANDKKEKQMLKSVINVIDNLQNPEGENSELLDYARENSDCSVELEGGGFVVVHPEDSEAED
jgi:hypothetical protein